MAGLAPGKSTIILRSAAPTDQVEFAIYDVSGTWQSDANSVTPGITLKLSQVNESVTGMFTCNAWTSSQGPDIGRGPLTGTVEWDRFVQSPDVAQGSVWTLTATIQIAYGSDIVILTSNEVNDPWQIQSDCGGGVILAIPELGR